jgi:hypothetical protein
VAERDQQTAAGRVRRGRSGLALADGVSMLGLCTDPLSEPHHRLAARVKAEEQRDDQQQKRNSRDYKLAHRSNKLTHNRNGS